jgi:hypothetical protein
VPTIPGMAEPAHSTPTLPGDAPALDGPALDTPSLDAPSLDPSAIEHAYRRERARRRARTERRSAVRRSNVRFWVSLGILAFLAAFVVLAAWHELQTLFGV